MDKKRLERYKPLKRELLMINKQISKLEERREELPVVMGKVQSSDHEFPYTARRATVQMLEPILSSTSGIEAIQCLNDIYKAVKT